MARRVKEKTIALDFDGVLHEYDGYRGGIIQGPRQGALDAVKSLLGQGNRVVVFTTRDTTMVNRWLLTHCFPHLEVTNHKRPFWAIVDDRAVRFEGDWQATLAELDAFEPYWVRARQRSIKAIPALQDRDDNSQPKKEPGA